MKKIRESIFLKLLLVFVAAGGGIMGLLEACEGYFDRPGSDAGLIAFVSTVILRSLELGVRELSKGNLEYRLPVTSQDEIGRIVRSFNGMAEQLREMMRTKEQLLLDVSHEFRSPLMRIKLALEVNADEKNSIRRSVSEMELMISELLESARLTDSRGRLRKEKTDITSLIRELIAGYKTAIPGVMFEDETAPLIAQVDAVRLKLAVQNLVENAIKYSSHQERPVQLELTQGHPGSIRISVRDYGVGIPLEDQGLIFEPFYRVDRSRIRSTGGYGLGLALTKRIVLAHEGKIEVQSEPGNTIFSIEIPA